MKLKVHGGSYITHSNSSESILAHLSSPPPWGKLELAPECSSPTSDQQASIGCWTGVANPSAPYPVTKICCRKWPAQGRTTAMFVRNLRILRGCPVCVHELDGLEVLETKLRRTTRLACTGASFLSCAGHHGWVPVANLVVGLLGPAQELWGGNPSPRWGKMARPAS